MVPKQQVPAGAGVFDGARIRGRGVLPVVDAVQPGPAPDSLSRSAGAARFPHDHRTRALLLFGVR